MFTVENIVIVGGGTAGWLTAAYLANKLYCNITVIDKEQPDPIGVGEATLLNFPIFMEDCGFTIDDWWMATEATYKVGIHFKDWKRKGYDIWHPFYTTGSTNGYTTNDLWTLNQHLDYKKYAIPLYDTSVVNNKIDFLDCPNTAFHVNATKLAKFLESYLVERQRVNLIRSEVVSINKNKDTLQYITLKNNQIIKADLFIDCTGFKSILNPTRKSKSLANKIFTNTAVACMVNYKDKDSEQLCYTTAHAVEHGWIWKTPVQSRIGTGLIFNNTITKIDEAKEFFINYWGKDRVSADKIRVLNWAPFYNPSPWDGNVIAIGLSAGFIEPLESTGIGQIIQQVWDLHRTITKNVYTKDQIELYNIVYKNRFDDSVDFVSFHYSNSERQEPFWQYVKKTQILSDYTKSILKTLEKGCPINTHPDGDRLTFFRTNWHLWAAQLGYPIGKAPIQHHISPQDSELLLQRHNLVHESSRQGWARYHPNEIKRLELYYSK